MPRRRRPPRPGALADLAPLRILKQIILLQISFYATALVLIVFTALAAGRPMSLELLLGWRSIRGDVTEGWMFCLVWMLNSLICVFYILLLIARSKLVPDFAITIHFIHLIITSLYSRAIPAYVLWWGLQISSAALMVFLGMWSCQWRELRPINFGKSPADSNDTNALGQDVEEQDDGVGFDLSRGKNTGRGRDAGGDYEMVSVKEGRSA